jgi:hypothetical protein
MHFLPAISLPSISGNGGCGGIAANADGTLIASVDSDSHCVDIFNVDRNGPPVVYGTVGLVGCTRQRLNTPSSACFVNRSGTDTLLISDSFNDRLVEVTVSGLFLRAIALNKKSHPCGIAYSGGVIAVALRHSHLVVLVEYETGVQKHFVGTTHRLWYPQRVTFTADGDYILVSESSAFRFGISRFCVANGAFVSSGFPGYDLYPGHDFLQCEDGRYVIAHGSDCLSVKVWGADGGDAAVQEIKLLHPSAICYSPLFGGVVVKSSLGHVHLLRDAWEHSSRRAWLSATCLQ